MKERSIRVGWSEVEITPLRPVVVQGQFHARLPEEILDRLTATALVLESGEEVGILVSCDLAMVSEQLLAAIRGGLQERGFPHGEKMILNATHTHTGPATGTGRYVEKGPAGRGVELPVQSTEETIAFIAERVIGAILHAWEHRAAGAVAFGLGQAIVARNRRWVNRSGSSTMYGNINNAEFSHIEGYEDHDLNILATYDLEGNLTGLVLNLACPSQVREALYALSADYWHETRGELRKRLGAELPILAQCSAAGDLAPLRDQNSIYNNRAEARMLELKQRDACTEIAHRIVRGVEEVLPCIFPVRESQPEFVHQVVSLPLPFNRIREEDAEQAAEEAAHYRKLYQEEQQKLEANPELRDQPRWYHQISRNYGLMRRHERVVERFEQLQTTPTHAIETHFIRLGEMAIATNPFEYYLDYGIQIKARSPAVQTFLVQLCGPGSYVPSPRSLIGGGYGSVPASNIFGPSAGDLLRERTLEELHKLWADGTPE